MYVRLLRTARRPIRINGRKVVESTKGGNGDRRSCGLVVVINEGSPDMSAANICLRIPRSAPASIAGKSRVSRLQAGTRGARSRSSRQAESQCDGGLGIILLMKVGSICRDPVANVCPRIQRGAPRFESMVGESCQQRAGIPIEILGWPTWRANRYYY